ncbi:MAG TPA: caspase family protein, partial [Allocoleopsis sp.]
DPKDIITLTDKNATRNNIETVFLEHLTKQAKPDDLILFHFSGYGLSYSHNSELKNCLVPIDGIQEETFNGILPETLLLLWRSLSSENIISVFDTSYNQFSTNLKNRSYPQNINLPINPEILAFQLKLQQDLKISPSQLKQIPGILLSAANNDQIAAEMNWGNLTTGLLTYALTQELWQSSTANTIYCTLNQTASIVTQIMGNKQIPEVMTKSPNQQISLTENLSADGVILGIEDTGKIQLSLNGITPYVMQNYGINSVFNIVGENNNNKLQIRSKEGIKAKAKIIGNIEEIKKGQLVEEYLRVLSKNIGLNIALDNNLERIEKVDATSALTSLPYISSVVNLGEQTADYIFGKIPETSNYGLFSLAKKLIPGTKGEAVKVAIKRLSAKLQTLLAVKLWRLTSNSGSSKLGVKANLEALSPLPEIIITRETLRNKELKIADFFKGKTQLIPTLSIGSKIQYTIGNYSEKQIYYMLLGIDGDTNAIASIPISPNLPINTELGELLITTPPGIVEMQLIISDQPFNQTLTNLTSIWGEKNHRIG